MHHCKISGVTDHIFQAFLHRKTDQLNNTFADTRKLVSPGYKTTNTITISISTPQKHITHLFSVSSLSMCSVSESIARPRPEQLKLFEWFPLPNHQTPGLNSCAQTAKQSGDGDGDGDRSGDGDGYTLISMLAKGSNTLFDCSAGLLALSAAFVPLEAAGGATVMVMVMVKVMAMAMAMVMVTVMVVMSDG